MFSATSIFFIHTKNQTKPHLSESMDTMIPRIVGVVSAVIGLLCYAFSSAFNHLFGDWNLKKIILYFIFSFIIFTTTLFGQKQRQSNSTRPLFKTHMAVLILLVTTVYSYFYDKAVTEKPDAYILISCFAFAVMFLSLSKQTQFGCEGDLANYFLGFFTILLMKIKLWLFLVGACFSYSLLILFHSSSNPLLPLHHHRGTQIHAHNSEEEASSFWTWMMRSRFGHELIRRMIAPIMRWTSTLHARFVELLGGHEKQAAAEVALRSISVDISEKGDSISFKNKLQELTQKKHSDKPTYTPTQSGPPHMPTFLSTVVVEGKEFHGEEAKSKKEAEQNAAKVAYLALKECPRL